MRYEKNRWISELNNPTRVNHDHSFVEKNSKIPERYEIGDILTTTKIGILTFFDSFKSHIRHSSIN